LLQLYICAGAGGGVGRHPAALHASSDCVLVLFWMHWAVSWLQLYISAGVGGTHVAAQPACVSWPDPATHVLLAGSVHV
jgi:hypothetical protein